MSCDASRSFGINIAPNRHLEKSAQESGVQDHEDGISKLVARISSSTTYQSCLCVYPAFHAGFLPRLILFFTMSDNDALVVLRAYNIDGYPAPNQCEMCNASLPDIDSRRKQMAETWHRACRICEGYVPVGGYYGHCEERYGQDKWNDHQVVLIL